MTRCRCIEEFEIPKVDGDGFETGQHALVEADSLWILDEKTNYIGGQNHLECEDFLTGGLSWIEIDDETMERYFEVEE